MLFAMICTTSCVVLAYMVPIKTIYSYTYSRFMLRKQELSTALLSFLAKKRLYCIFTHVYDDIKLCFNIISILGVYLTRSKYRKFFTSTDICIKDGRKGNHRHEIS